MPKSFDNFEKVSRSDNFEKVSRSFLGYVTAVRNSKDSCFCNFEVYRTLTSFGQFRRFIVGSKVSKVYCGCLSSGVWWRMFGNTVYRSFVDRVSFRK